MRTEPIKSQEQHQRELNYFYYQYPEIKHLDKRLVWIGEFQTEMNHKQVLMQGAINRLTAAVKELTKKLFPEPVVEVVAKEDGVVEHVETACEVDNEYTHICEDVANNE